MMCFGFSGRQTISRQEIVTGSNEIRAGILADLVANYQVVVRRVVRGYGGKPEVYSYPNPAVEHAIKSGYTYPQDWAATCQAFRDLLLGNDALLGDAEAQNITCEGVDEEIEKIYCATGEHTDA